MHRPVVLFIAALTVGIAHRGLSAQETPSAQSTHASAMTAMNGIEERTVVEKTIRDAIGWALTKDRRRLEGIMAHDAAFFIFHPDSKSTIHGWDEFAKMIPDFMDPRFKATRFAVNELETNFSRAGDVAWYSAILEDCGEWDGKPSCWKDTRWTGVLEKREGRWVIVQMHFSFAKDKVLQECPPAAAK